MHPKNIIHYCVDGYSTLGEIISRAVKQKVNIKKSNLVGISLKFGTFKRYNFGSLSIRIINPCNQNILFSKTISFDQIEDCSWHDIFFEKLYDINTFTIEIIPLESSLRNAVTLFYKKGGSNYFNVGNQKLVGSLLLKIFTDDRIEDEYEIFPGDISGRLKEIVGKDRLSICCLTYNHAKYIDRALNSFLSQKTNFKFKIIISDDASTDGTTEIIRSYQRKYPDIIDIIYNNYNTSAMDSFINLLRKVDTEYVALCEGDDYWTKEYKIQKQVDFLDRNKDYSLSFHSVIVKDEIKRSHDFEFPKKEMIEKYLSKGFATLDDISQENFIQTNSVVYRWGFNKDSIMDNLPNDILPGDWYLHILHSINGKIGFMDEAMSVYRRHSGGIWQGGMDKIIKKYGIQKANFFKELRLNLGNKFTKDFNSLLIKKENYLLERYQLLNKYRKKVSVIVPTYNHQEYIRECIESIIMQKGNFDIEIVVGNDNSSDDTAKILSEYPQLKIINNKTNLGLLKNIKNCFYECTGDYISFCEGDDFWTSPFRLLNMVNFLDENEDCSSCFNFVSLKNNQTYSNHSLHNILRNGQKISHNEMLSINYPGNFSCCLYRKDVLDNFMTKLSDSSDWIFNLHATKYGKIGFIKDKYSVWRIHSKGSWSGLSIEDKAIKVEEVRKKISTIFG